MIIRLGSDLCNIERIQPSRRRFGAGLQANTLRRTLARCFGRPRDVKFCQTANILAVAALLGNATPVISQPLGSAADMRPSERTASLIAGAKKLLDDADVGEGCKPSRTPNEIIVCGRESLRLAIPELPRADNPPKLKLRAPPPGKGAGVSVSMTACFLQECPKRVLFIDVKSLPQAPPGSDADLIARGEMSDR